ncbi:MAG: M14-type cytosolic carboxypeptidase [Sneathiellaceae bacterium]
MTFQYASARPAGALQVSDSFDGGNILVDDASRADDIRLRIRADNASGHLQWFYFRLSGAAGQECRLHLVNASEAAFARGYDGYQACASYDREDWFRVPTAYDGSRLTISHRPERNAVWYAYFAPYSLERHARLLARAQMMPDTILLPLGRTCDGRDLDALRIGTPAPGKTQIWAIARQHPGETMAEWWMEGFLDRLARTDDPAVARLRRQAVIHAVPNMNPDGSFRGNIRTNAAGMDLNRAWLKPDPETTPEVHAVRQAMFASGVDICLDVHGDEALPYAFIAGYEGLAHPLPGQLERLAAFRQRLAAGSALFQTEHGYPAAPPGRANLNICTSYLAHTFGCLSMTLEQPFKDNKAAPDPRTGYDPAACRRLAGDCIEALADSLD